MKMQKLLGGIITCTMLFGTSSVVSANESLQVLTPLENEGITSVIQMESDLKVSSVEVIEVVLGDSPNTLLSTSGTSSDFSQSLLPNLTNNGISTYAWGGIAPQVTKIEPSTTYSGFDTDGNYHIGLKVTGYGNDRNSVTFDGKSVSSTYKGYFINYGNSADGFYYSYNCGKITSPGTYVFKGTYTSTNSPYSTLGFSYSVTFTYA